MSQAAHMCSAIVLGERYALSIKILHAYLSIRIYTFRRFVPALGSVEGATNDLLENAAQPLQSSYQPRGNEHSLVAGMTCQQKTSVDRFTLSERRPLVLSAVFTSQNGTTQTTMQRC